MMMAKRNQDQTLENGGLTQNMLQVKEKKVIMDKWPLVVALSLT